MLTGAGTPPAAITSPLAVPLRLLLDVVPVSRGTTVSGEVLGSGNAALANQSFTLAKSPLTYLASAAGAASTLTIYVDGVEWKEVPSFYQQAPDARVFVVSRSPDQTVTTVTFGDGVNGARLTSGTGNVVASYRYGSGAASPPARRLTTISQPQPNLASIQNPVAVSGGADPQAPDDVRADAPASTFTFGRAISATDYEIVASRAPGVARAAAVWTFDRAAQRTLVTVYVGDDQAAVGRGERGARRVRGPEPAGRRARRGAVHPPAVLHPRGRRRPAGSGGDRRGDGGALRPGERPVQPGADGHRPAPLPQRHRGRAHGPGRRRRARPHGDAGAG